MHGIKPEIIPIDDFSAYWKKTDHVQIQYWRYEQSKFALTDNEKEELEFEPGYFNIMHMIHN